MKDVKKCNINNSAVTFIISKYLHYCKQITYISSFVNADGFYKQSLYAHNRV